MSDIFLNKVAVVTGGASGLGAALAKELVAEGATVIIADIAYEKAQDVATSLGKRAHAIALDVSNAEEMDAAVRRITSDFGALDLFFNDAGTSAYGEACDLPVAEWDRVLRVNVLGVIYGSLSAYRAMKEQGSGKIINIGSGSVFTCDPLFGPYITSKFGVVGFTRVLAIEAEAYNVDVSVVCPGNISTPMLDLKAPSWLTPAISAETAARCILQGIVRNRKIIVFPFRWRIVWWVDRLNPALLNPLRRVIIRRARRLKSPS
jgi:NAD(P)-dependent dehydrogenase (short-subunit alcohol dehydrogenase family)